MKLVAFAALVAGAGIAQVTASPIRIITITQGIQDGPHNVDGARFGHPVPLPPTVGVANVWASEGQTSPGSPPRMRRPCGGRMSRFRQKGIKISNAFRKALGLPLIANAHPHHNHPNINVYPTVSSTNGPLHGMIHAKPGYTYTLIHPGDQPPVPVRPSHHHHAHHQGMRVHRVHGASFATRLHYSLMNLGRWEGRAVAFVLGCGIGVLLRMFWVLAIVTYRALKGQREDEHEYSHITIIEEYDEVPVHTPPPTYTYPVDVKVAPAEDKAPEVLASTEESK